MTDLCVRDISPRYDQQVLPSSSQKEDFGLEKNLPKCWIAKQEPKNEESRNDEYSNKLKL